MSSFLQKFNAGLSYANDGLRFVGDLVRRPAAGETTGSKIAAAGWNLFANTTATSTAAWTRAHTGSNMGYMAKYSAGNNAFGALANTTTTASYLVQMGTMFGCRRGGMYNPMMGSSFMMNPFMTYNPMMGSSFMMNPFMMSNSYMTGWFC